MFLTSLILASDESQLPRLILLDPVLVGMPIEKRVLVFGEVELLPTDVGNTCLYVVAAQRDISDDVWLIQHREVPVVADREHPVLLRFAIPAALKFSQPGNYRLRAFATLDANHPSDSLWHEAPWRWLYVRNA